MPFIVCEVTDPQSPKKTYCLYRNPLRAEQDAETREALLEKTTQALNVIAGYKNATTVERLGARIEKRCINTKWESILLGKSFQIATKEHLNTIH